MSAATADRSWAGQQALRQHNFELLLHVDAHQPCSFADLMAAFGGEDSQMGRNRFSKRLSYLVSTARLALLNHSGVRHYVIAPDTTPAGPGPLQEIEVATPESDPTPPWVGTVVPPRQVDVMHLPPYVPDAGPANRPGALDYKRVASYSVRC